MKLHKAWLWAAAGGVLALVLVSLLVRDATSRTLLALLSIGPLLYVTGEVAKGYVRQADWQRRRYSKLRTVTDEFIIAVRNLNRLTVLAQDENPPENAREMIDEVVQRMRTLVDRIVAAAGQSDPSPGGDAGRAAD